VPVTSQMYRGFLLRKWGCLVGSKSNRPAALYSYFYTVVSSAEILAIPRIIELCTDWGLTLGIAKIFKALRSQI